MANGEGGAIIESDNLLNFMGWSKKKENNPYFVHLL